MKIALSTLLVFLVKAVVGQNITQPYFCNQGPCYTYELLQATSNYEIRQYAIGQYIQSTATDSNYTAAFQDSFLPLFQYLHAFNTANATVESGGLSLSATNISANATTLATYVNLSPAQLNNSAAPQPLNPNVTFYTGLNGTYAVGTFGDFATGPIIQAQAAYLAGNLTADNIAYSPQLYSAIYDSPFQLTDRHNEVWYALTNYTAPASTPSASSAG